MSPARRCRTSSSSACRSPCRTSRCWRAGSNRSAPQGGNPFNDYQLPSAIIKFKQGFGRLIRSKTDTGIVVVLDNRIVSKPYGRRFLAAIPKCRILVVDGG